jgi:hypothetical protein
VAGSVTTRAPAATARASVGIPGAPAAAAELDAHLDRYLAALAPWATGTRFTSFAERRSSLETCVPAPVLERLAGIREAVDPDRLLVASHAVP